MRRFSIGLAVVLALAILPACEGDEAGNPFADATAVTSTPTTATTAPTTTQPPPPPTTQPPETTTTTPPTTTTTSTTEALAAGWSDEVAAEYLAGCVEDGDTEYCLCTLGTLEQTYSEEEFVALAEVWDGIDLPQGVIDAIEFCGGSVGAEPLTLWTDTATIPVLTAAASAFEADTGIPVAITGFDYPRGELFDALSVALDDGSGPDLFVGLSPWVPAFAEFLLPVELGADQEAQLTEAAVAAFNPDGTIVGLPLGVSTSVLVRNADLVPVAPADWDEFRAACDAARASTERCLVADPTEVSLIYTFMASGGGYAYAYDRATGWNDADVGIDTDGAIESFTEFDNLVRQGHIRWDDAADPTIELIEGRTAFAVVAGQDVEATFVATPLPYATSPFPSLDEGRPAITLSFAMGLMVNAASAQPEAARQFVRYLVQGEIMRGIAAALGFGSVHADSIDQITDVDLLVASLAGSNSQAIAPLPTDYLSLVPLVEAGGQIYRQTNGPIQVLREAADRVRQTVAEYREAVATG